MSVVFLNGEFVDEKEAQMSINDTGYYFGDGIYEVVLLYNGKLIDKDLHLNRLQECFKKVYFKNVPTKEWVLEKINQLIEKNNNIKTCSIYMQFSRGITTRDNHFSHLNLRPSCLIKMIPCEIYEKPKAWNCNLIDDPRRFRCDIKMISLMPMVLAKYESEKEGYDDVIFFNKNINSITEGSSFNVFIVDKDNKIITCPLGNHILPGCTRARCIDIFKNNNYEVIERFYSKEELFNAKEVFITGSIKLIVGIPYINKNKIGNGEVGTTTKWIYQQFINFLNK